MLSENDQCSKFKKKKSQHCFLLQPCTLRSIVIIKIMEGFQIVISMRARSHNSLSESKKESLLRAFTSLMVTLQPHALHVLTEK